jgi:hypothetical protein
MYTNKLDQEIILSQIAFPFLEFIDFLYSQLILYHNITLEKLNYLNKKNTGKQNSPTRCTSII